MFHSEIYRYDPKPIYIALDDQIFPVRYVFFLHFLAVYSSTIFPARCVSVVVCQSDRSIHRLLCYPFLLSGGLNEYDLIWRAMVRPNKY